MKGFDVLVVRFLPFLLYVILCINVINSWSGNDIALYLNELHGNSVFYALGFFLVSLVNKRYHCIWNRAMYIVLIIIPTINFLDATFGIFSTSEAYMLTIEALLILAAIATAYLAIRHFIHLFLKNHEHELKPNSKK